MVSLRNKLRRIKNRLVENSFDNLLWLVMVGPSLVGYQITRKNIFVPFWIIHLSLLVYVYVVGIVVYQANYAQGASDYIKSYVNVSILVFIVNNSYWWIKKRDLLKSVLKKSKESDTSTIQAGLFVDKYERSLSMIKRILIVFYSVNTINEFTSYLPKRVDLNADTFAMTPCVGIEPLTSSPQREVCIALATIQEITILNTTHSFQSMMLLLIAHTSVLYRLLSEEIMTFSTLLADPANYDFVKRRLSVIVYRHVLILDITKDLRALYSIPMGINFGSNAVCMCFFFFLEPTEYFSFMPIVVYCFIVFFLYCFLGQRLTNAAEMFSQAVYNSGWEMMHVKERRAIFSMLLQSQKEVDLLAADLIPVNMSTFATTCQAMYKFITVFKL
ncbi:uncharacterized protein LOC125228342 [Leguminivora glycinivorella]|uniref:uncharacterized protein LOC125228342 n=1 Tax=Leguminivora glycinivorella TaxID=1035111 RepID=UPI00200BFFC5|nr:uncharacterized protein LOC125228342 [Leguminivora glycinivorella]